ncbi:hypothetical protein [Herbiconiux sp. YIM B11900]|uniref:hypothetical protein n=1 Tax=Herbiconiux sp. YIM B11900 TaxID=3404131 RepID=UPI003F871DCA
MTAENEIERELFRRALIKIEADLAEARSVTWTLGAGMEPALEVRLANGAEHLIARVRGLEVDLAAAEVRAAEAEAVITEAPHAMYSDETYCATFAGEDCDCWKSRYRAGANQ